MGTGAVAFVLNGGKDDPSKRSVSHRQARTKHSLFWIVSQISENSGVYSPGDPVEAFHNNSILVCLDEFIVKQYPPDRMNKFSFAVGEEVTVVFLAGYQG